MRKIIKFLDKLEDGVRAFLSKFPVFYAFIGGIGIVLFWMSVADIADAVPFMGVWHSLPWLIVSIILLLISGVFVSYFVGDSIIMSGLRGDKKTIEKTREEVLEEEDQLIKILDKLKSLEAKLDKLTSQDKQ